MTAALEGGWVVSSTGNCMYHLILTKETLHFAYTVYLTLFLWFWAEVMTPDKFTGMVFVRRRLCVFCEEATELLRAYRLIAHFFKFWHWIYSIYQIRTVIIIFYHRHTTVIIIVIFPRLLSSVSSECSHHNRLLYLSLWSPNSCHLHNQAATSFYTKRLLSKLSLSSSYCCNRYRNHHQTAVISLCHHQPAVMITYYCICLYHHQTPIVFITKVLPSFSTSSDCYGHYHYMLSSVPLSPPWR